MLKYVEVKYYKEGFVKGWLVGQIDNDDNYCGASEYFKYKASALEKAKEVAKRNNINVYEFDMNDNLKKIHVL